MAGPLGELRVLETASGVAGPYAGRLFAMLGATVVKVEPARGDPARWLPVDDEPVGDQLSPVFVHLNAGKQLADGSLLDRLIDWADVVIDDGVAADRDGHPLAPEAVRIRATDHDRRVLLTTSPWGYAGPAGGQPSDELIVQAASGLFSATASSEPDQPRLRFPGWQSQYLAGAYGAAAVLAMLGAGGFHHVDVAWVDAVLTGVEAQVAVYLQAASRTRAPAGDQTSGVASSERNQAGIQSGAFPAGAFACADGYVIPGTVRPVDWTLQCQVYDRADLLEDERFTWRNRWANRETLREELAAWYAGRTKREIFAAALDTGWAAAMVMTAGDLLADPHIAERGFLSPLADDGGRTMLAGRPWRAEGIPEGAPAALPTSVSAVPAAARPSGCPRPPAPSRLRVVELTLAWAGPFVGRFLSAFGADVVRVESGRHPDGWRTRLRWRDAGVDIPPGVDPEQYTYDAAALFNSLGRGKRSVSIDLGTDGGRTAFGCLLEAADALIVNMTAGVLADRGVEPMVWDAVQNRGLVAVTMPAVGATGPYRSMPGYGTLTEGMGGFAARFGTADEGARVSDTYYPDPVAGVHASVAVLAGLANRTVTGEGSFIDLSQQEAMWLQLGEGLVLRSRDGREPARLGNREPGREIADLEIRSFRDRYRSGELSDRGMIQALDHPVTGRRDYLGLPVRVDGGPVQPPRAAPRFGQHTDEVLSDWCGLDTAVIAQLRAAGAIGSRPRTTPSGRRSSPAGSS